MGKTCPRILVFLIVLSMLVMHVPPIPVSAETPGDFLYDVDLPGTCVIRGYTGTGGKVVIPSSLGGYTVTGIASRAFEGNADITSIVLPSNVARIGSNAFADCPNLAAASLPVSLTEIGDGAFSGDASLSSMTMGGAVNSIGIGILANCTSLQRIDVSPSNPVYCSVNGVLFDKDATDLLQYPVGRIGTYSVPNGVEYILDYAFCGSEGLSGIVLPESLQGIGNLAFFGCLSIPAVVIPDDVLFVGIAAFAGCEALKNVYIGAGVLELDGLVLSDCPSLTGIDVSSGNMNYSSQDGVLFNEVQTQLLQYPMARHGSYAIPAGLTSIEPYAFLDCGNLTSISVPSGVKSIGEAAFQGCVDLVSCSLPSTHISHPCAPDLRGIIGVHLPFGSRNTIESRPREARNAVCRAVGLLRKYRCFFSTMT
jgi:hypothetical protein